MKMETNKVDDMRDVILYMDLYVNIVNLYVNYVRCWLFVDACVDYELICM